MLYLLALTCCTLISPAASLCNFGYIPLRSPAQHVRTTDQPNNWEGMAHQCRIQFPGHDLIGRHFLELSGAEKMPCADMIVPLGIVKINDLLVFPGGYGLQSDPADDSTLRYLQRMELESNVSNSEASVAALNLTTNKWWLVEDDYLFKCALCQMSHRGDLNASVFAKPPARKGHVYYGIVEQLESNSSSDKPSEELYEILSARLSVGKSDLLVNKTWVNSRNHTEFILRIRSLRALNNDEYSSYTISDEYKFVEFYDSSYCIYSHAEDMVWLYNKQDTVVVKKLPENVLATRECTFRKRPDGDWDAVWDVVRFWDFDRQAQCYLQEIKNVTRDVSEFAAKPPLNFDLASLFQQVVDRVDPLNYVNASELAAERNKIFNDISLAVVQYMRSPSLKRQVANNYFADIMLSNLREDDPLVGFEMTSVPGKLKGKFGVVRVSNLGSLEADLSVVLSKSMYSHKAAFAMAVVKDYQKDLFPTPIVKVVENTGYYLSNGFLLSVSFDNDDKLSLDEDYHLEVTIRNVVANDETARYLRNFAVWAIDDDEKLTETCLLVDVVPDSYQCRKMTRDLVSRSIRGRYVANRGLTYDDALNDTLLAANLISRYADVQVNAAMFSAVRDVANYAAGLRFGTGEASFSSRSIIFSAFREILSRVELPDGGATVTSYARRIGFLVGDLRREKRMVGFSKDRSPAGSGELALKPIFDAKNLSKTSEVDVILSPALMSAYSRLGFSVFDDFDDLFPVDLLSGQVFRKVSAVQVVLVSEAPSTPAASDETFYLDVYVNASSGQAGPERRRRCVLWNPDGGPNDKWSTTACYKLKSTRGSKQVFRCSKLNHGLNRKERSIAEGIYFTFEVSEFNDFLGENVALLVWLVIECVISLASLLSIFVTAIVIRKWRDDPGHNILLHMSSALAINIFFGFVNNFLILDTESVSCVAVGMIRHYSYMAMFFWMFVLSALQLKRLLSVLGSRSTPHLQLKVSAFAWGAPLIVIIVLFLSISDAYRSEIKDRGFCYPEGLGFELFVQGPAGLILASNVVIFVVILARVYACFGWGEVANLQRHANVRTVQLRRLRTAFFIFFLFGLTWTFHFLAEEGVIKNKFIFEYMFLMTACLHVFMLALFFVYLDDATRAEWKVVLENLVTAMRELKGSFT